MKRSFFVFGLLLLLGCGTSTGSVGIHGFALQSSCDGKGTGFDPSQIKSVRVLVKTADPTTGDQITLYDKNVRAHNGMLTVKDIPEAKSAKITLIANMADGAKWYGRHKHVKVTPEKKANLDVALTMLNDYSCVGAGTNKIPPVVFPAVTSLSDGRVLITGGFEKALYDDTAGTVTLSQPSKHAYIYDPYKGSITKLPDMSEARAAHAMVDIRTDEGEEVLIVGGAKNMKILLAKNNVLNRYPLQWSSKDALNSYELFDVQKKTFIPAGKDADGNKKQMLIGRVFPSLIAMEDGTVLVTGGGLPPNEDYNYASAQVFSPYADNHKGNFMGAYRCLQMAEPRSAFAVARVKAPGTPKYLFVGGTTNASLFAEMYIESSVQREGTFGAFKRLKLDHLPPYLFMPQLVPVGSNSFILFGGVAYDPKKKTFSKAIDAYYLLTIQPDERSVTVGGAKLPGISRIFGHAVLLPDMDLIAIVGGYTDLSGKKMGDIRFFDITKRAFLEQTDAETGFFGLGGFVLHLLPDDTLMMVGGLQGASKALGTAGLARIYASPVIVEK